MRLLLLLLVLVLLLVVLVVVVVLLLLLLLLLRAGCYARRELPELAADLTPVLARAQAGWDKWTNSGGKAGATLLVIGAHKIRRRYGSISRLGSSAVPMCR